MTPIRDGSIFSVPGIRGAAVKTGVKPSGALDLAIIRADTSMFGAGMFTKNVTAAAPVQVSRSALQQSTRVRTIVINSGNANALTGPHGRTHAELVKATVERQVGGPALVYSTGVIGVPLPIDRVLAGIPSCAARLDESGSGVAEAILTTDTRPKQCAVEVELSEDRTITVGGIAKGSGMIHPNLATMLAFIATDAPVGSTELGPILADAVSSSFHSITVDGDTSTNDAVLALGRDPGSETSLASSDLERVSEAVTHVARELAEMVVGDGEGATRVMEILVDGAPEDQRARAVASAIARSSLVKTALAGGDPNWGRILSAAGNAGVPLSVSSMTLEIAGHPVFVRGAPVDFSNEVVRRAFSQDRVQIRLTLGRGDGSARMLTTDLSKRYVEINSEYTT